MTQLTERMYTSQAISPVFFVFARAVLAHVVLAHGAFVYYNRFQQFQQLQEALLQISVQEEPYIQWHYPLSRD